MRFRQQLVERGFYILGENGEYLGVRYALLVGTSPSLCPGPCEYAAFDESGAILALGQEEGGPHAMGGWRWIRGQWDNRIVPDLSRPPRNPFTEDW